MEYVWGIAAAGRPFPADFQHKRPKHSQSPAQAQAHAQAAGPSQCLPPPLAKTTSVSTDASQDHCTCHHHHPRRHREQRDQGQSQKDDDALPVPSSAPKKHHHHHLLHQHHHHAPVVRTHTAPPARIFFLSPPRPLSVPGIATATAPLGPRGPVPVPSSNPAPAASPGLELAPEPVRFCDLPLESPSSSTAVCAACSKTKLLTTDSGLLLAAGPPTTAHSSHLQKAGEDPDQPRGRRPQQHHRRQSQPELTRAIIPGLGVPVPLSESQSQSQSPSPSPSGGPPLLPVREHKRLSRKSGRNRLSVPLTTPTSDRGRHHFPLHHAAMAGGDPNFRSQSVSAATSLNSRTAMSSNDLASVSRDDDESSTRSRPTRPPKPFVTKSNGRTYLSDPTLPYPLPVDLREQHRQSLRTLLLFQLFGGPVCSPVVAKNPPTRVLDLACGYGFWSMMCHSYFSRKGHTDISFTGLDIAPLGGIAGMPNPGNAAQPTVSKDRGSISSATGNWAEQPPDKNMKWNFVQHDLRILPLPFPDEEFDLIMCKEVSLVNRTPLFQAIMDELLRILKPGGVLETWDCDHPIRMLRPHVPDTPTTTTAPKVFDPDAVTTTNGNEASNGTSKKGEPESQVNELGAYYLGNNTPLSGPQNNFLIEYNSWVIKYLESQQLLNWPCANVGSYFIQEPLLAGHGSKRLAIPLTEVRWEREGVGGVVTKDGKSYINTGKAIGRAASKANLQEAADGSDKKGKALGSAQLALRQTALQTVLGFIEGMEPSLREISGKKQDEWDAWMGKLMKELIEKDGANCGECLEVGAWWARKLKDPPS